MVSGATPGPSAKVQPFSSISQCTTETVIMSSNHFSERKVSARCGAGETDVEVVAPPLRP